MNLKTNYGIDKFKLVNINSCKQQQEQHFILNKFKNRKEQDRQNLSNLNKLKFHNYINISNTTKNQLSLHYNNKTKENKKILSLHEKGKKQELSYTKRNHQFSVHQNKQYFDIFQQQRLKKQQQLDLSNQTQLQDSMYQDSQFNTPYLIDKKKIRFRKTDLRKIPLFKNKNNIYYMSKVAKSLQGDSKFFNHFENVFQGIKSNFKQKNHYLQQINNKKVNLYQNEYYIGKKTLIFDLDETLIHTQQNNNIKDFDINMIFRYQNNRNAELGLNVRPFAKQILKDLSKNFEIIIFTASLQNYANAIIDYLDPDKNIIQHRLFRESCIETNQQYFIKDLRIINRDLKNMIIIDNQGYSFSNQIENGIPILNFYDDKKDQELLDLEIYLNLLKDVDDVREFNNSHLKLYKCIKYLNAKNAISDLFL